MDVFTFKNNNLIPQKEAQETSFKIEENAFETNEYLHHPISNMNHIKSFSPGEDRIRKMPLLESKLSKRKVNQ